MNSLEKLYETMQELYHKWDDPLVKIDNEEASRKKFDETIKGAGLFNKVEAEMKNDEKYISSVKIYQTLLHQVLSRNPGWKNEIPNDLTNYL